MRNKHIGFKYYPRLKVWKNQRGTFIVDERTLKSHSYSWYVLGQWFTDVNNNKVYVVNSYNYSSMTTKHMYKLMGLLDDKGIRYIRLSAPRGLQDLEAAKEHYVWRLAELNVKHKYGRTCYKNNINHCLSKLSQLETLGVKYNESKVKECIIKIEQSRRKDLDRKKVERAEKRKAYLATLPGQLEQFSKQLNKTVNR